MPLTAKFSQALYDRLGHAVADELVDWFNQVDATYRSNLRELNELNFARFDAKLEQRVTELRAELTAQLGAIHVRLGAVETGLERRLGEQSRWLFGMWLTIVAAAVALWFRR